MPETQLTRTIALLYRMHDADRDALYERLLEQRKKVWATALRQVAREHGLNVVPNAPRGRDLQWLKEISRTDADSIVKTWNRDVTREIERLYAANPRGNRQYYFSNLEQWNAKRNEWKLPQIALVTDTTTTEYARRRFAVENYGGSERYVFAGPPPTCEDCTKRFAAGIVNRRYTERFMTPRHINCPHTWRIVRKAKLKREGLWLG